MYICNQVYHLTYFLSLHIINSEAGSIELTPVKDIFEEIGNIHAWQGIVSIYVLATVCSANIVTLHQASNIGTSVYSRHIKPRRNRRSTSLINIMMVDTTFNTQKEISEYRLNHYVPLVTRTRVYNSRYPRLR